MLCSCSNRKVLLTSKSFSYNTKGWFIKKQKAKDIKIFRLSISFTQMGNEHATNIVYFYELVITSLQNI